MNTPYTAMRYFIFLAQKLYFQNWIVWDALSNPVKRIMPAHYAILLFSKGSMPKVVKNYKNSSKYYLPEYVETCIPMDYGLCYRRSCMMKRDRNNEKSQKELTDLWTDIFRIKHNSLREDHPTLLPPKLLKRIILAFCNEGDLYWIVLTG